MVAPVVGIAEIADMLGVGRPHAHRLVRRADFPPPLARLRAGAVWWRADVERWAEEHSDRRPGRPPRGSM